MTTDGPAARSPELGKLMASEMGEQPVRLGALLSRREEIAKDIRSVVPARLEGTVLVARGSSDHAATYGAYVLEMATGRPVALCSPSVLTLYHHNTDYSGHLVIAISQSGQTPEIVDVLRHARERGARTVAVTNDAASPLANAADLPVLLGAGEELAVPATKTVTAQFTAFSIIAQSLGEIGLSDEVADALPRQVAEVLADPSPAAALAGWLADADRLVTLARGLLLGAAREAALKIAETTSMFTTGYSSADLRHGPIAIASRRPPFIAFAHRGPASPDVLGAVNELRARGATVALVGPVEGSEMGWPAAAPEILAPVLAVVRGQQLALSLARLLGRDPDAPPGLSKVTPT
jgi:glucosamine--fructose-6-phosphate aminotransferase (isomerizing)